MKISHSFALSNSGQAPLEIKKVRTGCGCATRRLEKKTLLPGESTDLEITLDLANRRGKQRRTIYVHTNDPQNRIFRLEITGEILSRKTPASPPPSVKARLPRKGYRAVRLQPEVLDFGRVHEEADISTCVDLSGGDEQLRVLSVSTTNLPSFRVWIKEGKGKGEMPSVGIKTLPPMPPGDKRGRVNITTSDPKSSSFTIPVTMTVMKDLYAIPEQITLISRPGRKPPVSRFLRIQSRKGKPFKIRKAKGPKRSVSVKSERVGKGHVLTIKGLRPDKELDGLNISVTTDLPGTKDLIVPIRVVSKP